MSAQEAHLEMWAGLECTFNRVGDTWINQEDKNGHGKRIESDLEMFSTIGVKKIRYPCLWETVAPHDPDSFDWDNLDARLHHLRKLEVEIIATFLHHGSGPKYTSLIDEDFPFKLEKYAKNFAERYPWVEHFTPINEINTTTRFSFLYGHWYPHCKMDHRGYVRSLFLQCKATILSMNAVRKVNPEAKLVQTDDLGKCSGREVLLDQVEFENHRRWLSWDMLCGKVDESHALYNYLKRSGLTDEEMNWLKENSSPPDYIGINHYHMSNRFLDERSELYPDDYLMDIGTRPPYADVPAVHIGEVENPFTPYDLMKETWDRYKLPVAVTEVHTAGDRADQMRWLFEVWNQGKKARDEGANVVAITVWSLLGTYDWHKLCTICELFYEPGVFDLRSPDGRPRPTAVSRLVKELSLTGTSQHPILQDEGWWRNNRRLRYSLRQGSFSDLTKKSDKKIVITGSGTLGQAFARTCGTKNIPYKLLRRVDLDIANLDQVRARLKELNPWAVINTAGYVKVDLAEEESERCFKENVTGPQCLAIACAELRIPLIHFSSDLVFDGNKSSPYTESDAVSPLNVYGHSKVQSEKIVLDLHPDTLVIRTSSLFGPHDEYNFVIQTLKDLGLNKEVMAANDVTITPTYVPDLTSATLDLLLDGVQGLVHLTNKGEVTWADLAMISATMSECTLNITPSKILPRSWTEMNYKAKRPRNSALVSEKYEVLPTLEDALQRYFKQLEVSLL